MPSACTESLLLLAFTLSHRTVQAPAQKEPKAHPPARPQAPPSPQHWAVSSAGGETGGRWLVAECCAGGVLGVLSWAEIEEG